jgi:hypothetical protein
MSPAITSSGTPGLEPSCYLFDRLGGYAQSDYSAPPNLPWLGAQQQRVLAGKRGRTQVSHWFIDFNKVISELRTYNHELNIDDLPADERAKLDRALANTWQGLTLLLSE